MSRRVASESARNSSSCASSLSSRTTTQLYVSGSGRATQRASTHGGNVRPITERMPRVLLHLEGAAVAIAAVALYFYADFTWWVLVVFALAPDLAMVGYLAGARVGAAAYNV